MPPPLQPLLLLLPLVAFFLRLPAPAAASCSPKRCGDLKITYPFWLEEKGQTPCGSPSFQLNCNASQALLSRSMLGGFQVIQIFADNSSFLAVDKNLPLDDGCPKWWFNISLGLGLSPFVISSKNRELLVLDKCSDQATPPPGFNRTHCANESFFRLGGEYGGHRELGVVPPPCRLSVVPILGFQDGGDYVPSMRQGFLLEWTVPSDDCPKCVASGGQCRYPNDGTVFSCNCSGAVYPDKCGSKRTGTKILLIDADTKPQCTVIYLKKFGGYLIGGCEDDCHEKSKEILKCSQDMECDWEEDIVGNRCRCTMCIYSSKAQTKETVMLTS